MKADVSIIVSTFGDLAYWGPIAEKAVDSAWHQTVIPKKVIRAHSDTLAKARNLGALQASTRYLIFLDADDTLDKRYVQAMMAATGDIRRPSTLGVVGGVEDDAPVMIPRRPLLNANFIVIGAMINREDFFSVGAFRELPVLEDYDLFIRLVLNGAEITDVPEAIYRVNVREGSRNRDQGLHNQVYNQIRQQYMSRREEFPCL